MKNKSIWTGALYSRGGMIRSKWGTVKRIPVTQRDKNTGVVVSGQGKILGIEQTHNHNWAADPKKKSGLKKPYALVRPHYRSGTRGVKPHTRRLR